MKHQRCHIKVVFFQVHCKRMTESSIPVNGSTSFVALLCMDFYSVCVINTASCIQCARNTYYVGIDRQTVKVFFFCTHPNTVRSYSCHRCHTTRLHLQYDVRMRTGNNFDIYSSTENSQKFLFDLY